MHTRLTLSTIVCCHSLDRWPLLVRAIDSLRSQEAPVDEIIIVVDHNDTLYRRAVDEFPDVEVIPNVNDRGLSGARNSGVRRATSDIVAFVDDDAECGLDWSRHILGAYVDDDILGVGGRVIPRFESTRPRWFPQEFDWVIGCTYRGARSSRGPIRNFIGANMSIRRSTFTKVGGFHPDLGRTGVGAHGCEETELCVRATKMTGGVFWYEPTAIVTHFVPTTRTSREYFRRRCFDEGVSKAAIARLVGRTGGLESERRYLARTIPFGVLREARHMLLLRPGAAGRLAALVYGVVVTAAGYLLGKFSRRRAPEFEPMHVMTVDVDAPVDVVPAFSSSGRPYGRALALVESHEAPLATIPLTLPEGRLSADALDALLEPLRRSRDAQPVDIASVREHGRDARPFVSVVIATRDRPKKLERTLESLWNLDYHDFEVIVVDNGSAQPTTRECVERLALQHRQLHYVYEPRAGLARAHNRGMQEARGEIVAFTDDDVVVRPAWLRAIVEAFGTDDDVECVTGLIYPLELETAPQWWTESFFGFGKGMHTRRFDLAHFRPGDPLFPFTAGRLGSGANMAFRTDSLRARGGFASALGTGTPARGGDDLAAFFDVIVSGHALVYEPRAIVHHEHHRSYSGLRRQAFGYGVGLGAYLTHVLVTHPRLGRRALRLAPRAARHMFHTGSSKNAERDGAVPRALKFAEGAGLFAGPVLYARSRFVTRNDRWIFDEVEPRVFTNSVRGGDR
jgi:GT2 family glycosyltransferase